MGALGYYQLEGGLFQNPASAVNITIPTGSTLVVVQCFGGGGSGKYHGGGGGAWAQTTFKVGGASILQPGGTLAVYLGRGGRLYALDPPSSTEILTNNGAFRLCRAQCGSDATTNSPGQGGSASSCTGDICRSGGNGAVNTAGILQGAGGGGAGRPPCAGESATGYRGGSLGGGNGGLAFFDTTVYKPTAGYSGGGGGGCETNQLINYWNNGGHGRAILQFSN